uniref:Uncharacterized protein n=1 Tax=Meloidogyne enterolobii TaxID=390850 RepID=A0A6V7VQL6_MELEN|nr:unnamed protein product [Meloidogyne enterolobii]
MKISNILIVWRGKEVLIKLSKFIHLKNQKIVLKIVFLLFSLPCTH